MNFISEFFKSTSAAELIGQSVGIVGMILAMISFQCKKHRNYCILQASSGASFALSFFILSSYTAALLNFFNILRGYAFGIAPEKSRKYFLPLLIILYTGASVATFDVHSTPFNMFVCVLVCTAQIAGTVVMYTANGKVIRIVQNVYISPAWMIHNIYTVHVGGILCEAFNFASSLIALIRFRKSGYTK